MFVDNSEVVDIIKLLANCKLVNLIKLVNIIKLAAICKLVYNSKVVSNIKVGDNTWKKRLVTIFCQNMAGGRKLMHTLAASLPDELILQPS